MQNFREYVHTGKQGYFNCETFSRAWVKSLLLVFESKTFLKCKYILIPLLHLWRQAQLPQALLG